MSNSEIINSIPEGSGDNDNLRPQLENIKFMKAFYGHVKCYVGCHPNDKGAFQLPDGSWVTEMDIKPGAEWQVRHAKLKFQDWLIEQAIPNEFLNKCKAQLFPPKNRWIAAFCNDSFNYFPKEITPEQFEEAKKEGLTLHLTQEEAQKECDNINSL